MCERYVTDRTDLLGVDDVTLRAQSACDVLRRRARSWTDWQSCQKLSAERERAERDALTRYLPDRRAATFLRVDVERATHEELKF